MEPTIILTGILLVFMYPVLRVLGPSMGILFGASMAFLVFVSLSNAEEYSDLRIPTDWYEDIIITPKEPIGSPVDYNSPSFYPKGTTIVKGHTRCNDNNCWYVSQHRRNTP